VTPASSDFDFVQRIPARRNWNDNTAEFKLLLDVWAKVEHESCPAADSVRRFARWLTRQRSTLQQAGQSIATRS
jgi:hypothetical protein